MSCRMVNKLLLVVLAALFVEGYAYQAAAADKTTSVSSLQSLAGKRVEVEAAPVAGVTREQAAQAYRVFLELQNADSRLRSEAMRRLADINLETIEVIQEEGSVVGPSLNELHESIALYEGLLKFYPDYANKDMVLYQLARAYESAGESDKALGVLDQLIDGHADSRWFLEAQFRRGEILFSKKRFADAAKSYAAVVELKNGSLFYDQALYKQGWSLFKLGAVDDSTYCFLLELDRLLIDKYGLLRDMAALSRAERELKDDILHALAVMASDEQGPESIDAMLKQHGNPVYAEFLYSTLGDLYLEKERYQDAAKAFFGFAQHDPQSLHAPNLVSQSIDAYQKGGFTAKVLESKQLFVDWYGVNGSFWTKHALDTLPEVTVQVSEHLEELARYYHAQANKTKKQADYMLAIQWYKRLLGELPNSEFAAANRFLLGELLFDAGHYAEAVAEYEQTAYGYPVHNKSSVAGYAALVAYKKYEAELIGAAREQWHRLFIESELKFASTYPADLQVNTVLTKATEDLFAINDFERTISTAQNLLSKQPVAELKQRRTVAILMAHSFFDLGRFSEAESAYLQARQLLANNDNDLSAINDRIAASIYKQAEAKQLMGNSSSAVDDFLRARELAPYSKISATAEYDAAAILITRNEWMRAIALLEQFRKNHPEHDLLAEVNKKLAMGYQETGKIIEAAAEYESIAAHRGESLEVRRVATLQAADLYFKAISQQKASVIPKSVRLYEDYVGRYPKPFEDITEARHHLVELARMQNDSKSELRWLREIVMADKLAGSERTERSKYLAAHASLLLLKPLADKFFDIKLTLPLSKTLKSKRSAMEALLSAYGQSLDYQVADVTTESTYGIAEVYRQMAVDILASERPKNLDVDALEQYEVLLEEEVFPFEEKAIALHESNVGRVPDGLYDNWIQKSYGALVQLVPARYDRNEVSGEYVYHLQ